MHVLELFIFCRKMQSIHGHSYENNCTPSGTTLALAVMTVSISSILFLLSIVGNILIILAVVLDPNKNLRTPFNWLIVNLAVADLITGIITDPVSASLHLKLYFEKKYPDGEVKVLHMSYFISCTASALSISSLAVERYLAVRKPNTYRTQMTNKRIVFTVAAIWLISLTLPNIYFKVGYTLYSFVFAIASVFLAISITCFTYILMWRKIKRRSQTVVNHDGRAMVNSLSSPEHQGSSTAPNNRTTSNPIITNTNKMEEKVTKMFLVVLIAMFCCYGPATLFIYLMNFCESCGCVALHWFYDLAFILIVINSSLNFCCYAMQSSRFRRAFIEILKIKKKNHQHHETIPKNENNGPDGCESMAAQREDIDIQMQEVVEITDNGI